MIQTAVLTSIVALGVWVFLGIFLPSRCVRCGSRTRFHTVAVYEGEEEDAHVIYVDFRECEDRACGHSHFVEDRIPDLITKDTFSRKRPTLS